MNMFHVNLQGCSMESTHLSHVTALTIIIKINTPTPTPDLTFSRTILEWRSKAFTRAKILRLLRQLISTCKAVAPWTPWNHLKMDGWNTFSFPFGFWPIIRCEVLVLGSVLCVSTANGQVQLWVGLGSFTPAGERQWRQKRIWWFVMFYRLNIPWWYKLSPTKRGWCVSLFQIYHQWKVTIISSSKPSKNKKNEQII